MFLNFINGSANNIKLGGKDIMFISSTADYNPSSDRPINIVVRDLGDKIESGISDSGSLFITRPGEFGFDNVNIFTTVVSEGALTPRMLTSNGLELIYAKLDDSNSLKEFEDIILSSSYERTLVIVDAVECLDSLDDVAKQMATISKKAEGASFITIISSSGMGQFEQTLKTSGIDTASVAKVSIEDFKLKKAENASGLARISLVF